MAEEVYEGAIGIDLGMGTRWIRDTRNSTDYGPSGTTYSCVANYEGTNVEISTVTSDHTAKQEGVNANAYRSCQ